MTAQERTDNRPLSQQVLDAAVEAWSFHGEACHIEDMGDVAPGLFAALAPVGSRRIEFVLNHAVDDHGWETLFRWPRSESWRLRALVPLALLGQAHEHLREGDFELQGWWVDEGRIAFGSVEIA